MCTLATERAGTPSRSGMSGKAGGGGEGRRQYSLVACCWNILLVELPKKEQAERDPGAQRGDGPGTLSSATAAASPKVPRSWGGVI